MRKPAQECAGKDPSLSTFHTEATKLNQKVPAPLYEEKSQENKINLKQKK